MTEIEQLQVKVAYQEDTIEQLNSALVAQQRQIQDIEFKLKHVMDKLKQVSVNQMASESEETPPPHY